MTGILTMSDGRLVYTGFERLALQLGSGSDVLNVDDTLTGTTVVNAGAGNDRVMVEALGGDSQINGEAGDDWLVVNAVPDPIAAPNPMDGVTLRLDGGLGADYAIVGLFGKGSTRIDVVDSCYDGSTNVLAVNGSAAGDTFLMRRRLIALLSDPVAGSFTHAEKVTYTDGINGGLLVNGLAGDDTFAFDDNASLMTVNGGSGNDSFRVGQLYTSYTSGVEFGLPTSQTDPAYAASFFAATRGWLSNGVSYATTMNGGSGDDTFEVLRNKAVIQLNGDAGDDTFIVRSFIAESETSAINAGIGRDFIQYATNAPVSIDGGEGYDTVVVIGTEADDKYVITADGVYGAGRYVTYINVERLQVHGMEGDDTFVILSTNPNVETSVFGGLGSDRVEVAGAATPVQADDLLGHTGLVRSSVESSSAPCCGTSISSPSAQ